MNNPPTEKRGQQMRVVVVGSINLDLVIHSQQLPRPGETVIGRDLFQHPGGKGANQAVAAARLGMMTSMIGSLGDDTCAETLRTSLTNAGIDIRHVSTVSSCGSGVAVINVEDSGQNCITVIPGANAYLSVNDLYAATDLIQAADVLLLQLEIPVETVLAAIGLAKQFGVITVLDPAPALRAVPPHLLHVDVLCPNETEAEVLTGIVVRQESDAARAARRLRDLGARQAVITLGERGALICDENDRCEMIPSCVINPVDTTAAGDAFAAALALRLAEGADLSMATRFACAAGAVAASRPGAQPSMPDRQDVDQLLNCQADSSN